MDIIKCPRTRPDMSVGSRAGVGHPTIFIKCSPLVQWREEREGRKRAKWVYGGVRDWVGIVCGRPDYPKPPPSLGTVYGISDVRTSPRTLGDHRWMTKSAWMVQTFGERFGDPRWRCPYQQAAPAMLIGYREQAIKQKSFSKHGIFLAWDKILIQLFTNNPPLLNSSRLTSRCK